MTTPIVAPVANNLSKTLRGIIHNCGLGTGLDFVLDAADLTSHDGSSQTWTDPVGGYNFYRGEDGTSEATDPTFNGTAGLPTESTYFSFDGGDFFNQTAAHAFANDWHMNNAACSIVAILYGALGGGIQSIFDTGGAGGAPDGVFLAMDASEVLTFQHNTSNAAVENVNSGLTVTAGAWNFIGVSFDEAGPTINFRVNASTAAPAVSASTATDAQSGNLRIGARTSGAGNPLISGTRLAAIAGWSAAIGSTALTNLYNVIKSRRSQSIV